MDDLFEIGRVPAVQKLILREGLLDGSYRTVTGKTLAENLADIPDLAARPPSGPGFSLLRAQHGSVSARRAEGCCRSPSPYSRVMRSWYSNRRLSSCSGVLRSEAKPSGTSV
jgi:Dehydratase family